MLFIIIIHSLADLLEEHKKNGEIFLEKEIWQIISDMKSVSFNNIYKYVNNYFLIY